jgi:hypothetical protein
LGVRILPEPGAARILTLATLGNTMGHGVWLTASALLGALVPPVVRWAAATRVVPAPAGLAEVV